MLEIGKSYKFHTALGIWIGKVRAIEPEEILLDQCSWIPDEGRMSECTVLGTYNLCEFVGDGVIIPRGGIVIPWRHELPSESK